MINVTYIRGENKTRRLNEIATKYERPLMLGGPSFTQRGLERAIQQNKPDAVFVDECWATEAVVHVATAYPWMRFYVVPVMETKS